MARIDKNDLTLGLRGKFGDQFLFRKYRKRTIALRRFEVTRSNTEAQLQHREKFRLATLYAKRCMLTPDLKSDYERIANATENTAFAAAVTDFLKQVVIQDILTATYNGQAGFPLTIMVNDVFKVKTMTVSIIDASGAVVESGEASIMAGSSGYSYLTTVDIPDITGLTIKVEVTDRPGKMVSHEVTLQ